jgi:CheY-like chemotaxis protein
MKYSSGLKLKGKTILVVEDDFVCSELIKELLIDTHAEILHSLTASKAIDIVIMNPKIDLVIMDVQLPDMSGLQASSSIKGINSKIPIIIQTAYSFESYMKKSEEIGCDCFLLKPVDPQKLFEAIKKILQKKSR